MTQTRGWLSPGGVVNRRLPFQYRRFSIVSSKNVAEYSQAAILQTINIWMTIENMILDLRKKLPDEDDSLPVLSEQNEIESGSLLRVSPSPRHGAMVGESQYAEVGLPRAYAPKATIVFHTGQT